MATVQAEVPAEIFERVDRMCRALPEVTVHVDHPRTSTRSVSWSYEVRGRSFCLLVAALDPRGIVVPIVRLRADPSERAAVLTTGSPYFPPRAGPDRLGVWLGEHTDWTELRELVTDSFRLVAPKKLTAQLE